MIHRYFFRNTLSWISSPFPFYSEEERNDFFNSNSDPRKDYDSSVGWAIFPNSSNKTGYESQDDICSIAPTPQRRPEFAWHKRDLADCILISATNPICDALFQYGFSFRHGLSKQLGEFRITQDKYLDVSHFNPACDHREFDLIWNLHHSGVFRKHPREHKLFLGRWCQNMYYLE